MRVFAPAKINVHLEVKERRLDGFHDLESLFVCLDFGDELYFELSGKNGFWDLSLDRTSNPDIIKEDFLGENNLISRAVCIFREKTGFEHGIKCVLNKKVPLGAGLGGGSSNAASTLLALNELASTGLSENELLDMALSLGSDVPFFIKAGMEKTGKSNAAWVKGRGEHIFPLLLSPSYPVLLVKPPFQSNTAEAFALLSKYRRKQATKVSGTIVAAKTRGLSETSDMEKIWACSPDKWPFFNDFLDVLPNKEIYQEILLELKNSGALFTGLSGSGSCCFGIFSEEKIAQTAETTIKSKKIHKNFTHLTFILAKFTRSVLK